MTTRWLASLLFVCSVAGAQSEVEDLKTRVDALERELEEYIEQRKEGGDGADGSHPTAGYDGRFFIQSRDAKYRLQFQAYTQIRYEANRREVAPSDNYETDVGWTIPRTRIILDGDLTERYYFHFRFNVGSDGSTQLIAAFLQWNAPNEWAVRIGEQFIGLSREDWILPMDLLTTEFSANDVVFALGTSVGVQAIKTWESLKLWAAFSDGRSQGRGSFGNSGAADWAFSFRLEWMFLGTDWSVWADLVGRRGRAFAMMLGIAALYQGGVETLDVKRGGEVILDFNINGDGYQGMVAFTLLFADETNPSAPANTFQVWGVLVQYGHFIAEKWQIFGQYDGVFPGSLDDQFDPYSAIGVGVNFFPVIETNKQKFTFEIRYLFSAINDTIVPPSELLGFLASDGEGQLLIRFQLQFGF